MIHEELEQLITYRQMHEGKLGTTEVNGREVLSVSANGIRGGVLLSVSNKLKAFLIVVDARQHQVVSFGSDAP
jgi:hypothetical protein